MTGTPEWIEGAAGTAGLDARAAAELTAVLLAERGIDAMPAALAARVVADGERIVAAQAAVPAHPARPAARGDRVLPLRARLVAQSGWALAAAATALLVVQSVRRGAAPVEPTVATLQASGSVLRLPLASTTDAAAAGAGGEVLWSTSRQEGVLRLHGLMANLPAQWQYQLWIFDAERDERYPVDGGVFDMPAGAAEIDVPVHARLRVGRPVLFAITVERAGGVVVSKRERVVLVAKAAG